MSPADQFSALADPTRCRVIELLNQRPMPVHELTAAFDISRPAISRHLRVLKEARLVKEDKHGRENIYSLQRQKLKPLLQWLERQGAVKAAKAEAIKVEAKPADIVIAPKPRAPKPVVAKVVPPPPVAKAQMQLDLF